MSREPGALFLNGEETVWGRRPRAAKSLSWAATLPAKVSDASEPVVAEHIALFAAGDQEPGAVGSTPVKGEFCCGWRASREKTVRGNHTKGAGGRRSVPGRRAEHIVACGDSGLAALPGWRDRDLWRVTVAGAGAGLGARDRMMRASPAGDGVNRTSVA